LAEVDNPKPTVQRLASFHDAKGTPQQGERVVDALRVRAKNPNATVARWRVEADIGETEIERDERSVLRAARVYDCGIRATPELLSKNCLYVVTGVTEQ
jgi:hypothetical protein